MNVEYDRLSSLPDDLIHKILSFTDTRTAIETSVLSSRWKFVWTSMPYLSFSNENFSKLPKFSKFVRQVMSRRNNQTEVYSMKLSFHGKGSPAFLKRIMKYALSHVIQELNVECRFKNDIEFPLSLFNSQPLNHLSLRMHTDCWPPKYNVTSSLELPTLTTLDLNCVTFCIDNDIFSKCVNLRNLTLKRFIPKGSNNFIFSISNPRLSNLTLETSDPHHVKVVNVAAPQLKNLTIKYCHVELVISAPDLASFNWEGCNDFHLSTAGFHSLDTADIRVTHPKDTDARQIVSLLQLLHNVNFLTLNLEIVELLSSSVGLFLHQTSPFVNLKSLKIYPYHQVFLGLRAPKKVAMSNELKSYLLDSSPGCVFTMVLREEIIAKKLMAELQVLLVKERDFTKRPVKSHKSKMKTKQKNGGNMAQIKSCWKNLGVQIELRKKKGCRIISKLNRIEKLLKKLPASYKAKIQPGFSSMCAEADIVINKLTEGMKIQCEESQSRSSVLFHELATALVEPSSSSQTVPSFVTEM